MKFDMGALNTFAKGIDDKHQVRVGILGNKNARGTAAEKAKSKTGAAGAAKTSTNSEIGFLQEYGSIADHIPPRSFLRMPLALKGKQIVKEASVSAQKLLAAGKIVMVLQRLGVACVAAIDDAFASRGFGKWDRNAPLTIKIKGYDSPLIQTSQLRRSITYKVVSL